MKDIFTTFIHSLHTNFHSHPFFVNNLFSFIGILWHFRFMWQQWVGEWCRCRQFRFLDERKEKWRFSRLFTTLDFVLWRWCSLDALTGDVVVVMRFYDCKNEKGRRNMFSLYWSRIEIHLMLNQDFELLMKMKIINNWIFAVFVVVSQSLPSSRFDVWSINQNSDFNPFKCNTMWIGNWNKFIIFDNKLLFCHFLQSNSCRDSKVIQQIEITKGWKGNGEMRNFVAHTKL